MKKLYTMILMAVVLFTACSNEDEPVAEQIVTIQATIAHDSRVALGDTDEKKVNWTEGDIVNLTINEVSYPFIWKGGTTFEYKGNDQLPILTPDLQITATYVSTFNATQSGLKADVGNYMALSTEKTITTEQNYEDLNLTFSHGTSVLKLTLSNENFNGNDVTGVTLKAGGTVVATATATFKGDASGNVTAYLAIQPSSLQNITIHATCNGNTYTNSLANKTVEAGKIYLAEKNLPYAYVDLGLPSGTKWASFNVGATSPEEAGSYFAWGETEAKDYYSWRYYTHANGNELSLTKYCYDEGYGNGGFTDELTKLEPTDDVATAKWGSYWRVPTSAEMQELKDNCTLVLTTRNGVNGCLITSNKNGNSIFLPAANKKTDHEFSVYGYNMGCYWSNSLDEIYSNKANIFYFDNEDGDYFDIWETFRFYGCSVRPVYIGN